MSLLPVTPLGSPRKRGAYNSIFSPVKRRRVGTGTERGTANQASFINEVEEELEVNDQNIEKHRHIYEHDLRMITENKVNAANSWRNNLIGYFSNLNVLRTNSIDDDSSINFQKAGATLEGCMKVLAHRIDSVANDTGRLLSGLGRGKNKNILSVGDQDEEEDDDEEYLDDKALRKKKAATERKPKQTLVSSFDRVKWKQLDKELNIDPLFKKMLSDFDEGGTKSLLTNSLKVDSEGRIAFVDSATTESKDPTFVNPDKDDLELQPKGHATMSINKDKNHLISLLLPKTIFADLGIVISEEIPKLLEALEEDDAEKADRNLREMNERNEEQEEIDHEDVPLDTYDYAGGGDDDEAPADYDSVGNNSFNPGEEVSFENGKVEELAENEVNVALKTLDNQLSKSWNARTTHWRVDRMRRSRVGNYAKEEDNGGNNNNNNIPKTGRPRKGKKTKEEFRVDFEDASTDESDKIIFKKGDPKKMVFPESSRGSSNSELTTLPQDLRWTSSKLVSMFLKPEDTVLKQRRIKKRKQAGEELRPDEEFWANKNQAVAHDDEHFEDGPEGFRPESDDPIGACMPVGTQDDDDYGYDYDFETPTMYSAPLSPTLQLSSSQPESILKVKKEFHIKYAKVAKRVNVRELKQNLWESVTNFEDHSNQHKIKTTLSDVVKETKIKYEGRKRREITTSFYFICMLHLANEHGLTISNLDEGDNLQITGQVIDLDAMETEENKD